MKLAKFIKTDFQADANATTATTATPAPPSSIQTSSVATVATESQPDRSKEKNKASDVATVASVAVASVENKISWKSFIQECKTHGVSVLEVTTLFNQQDIDDLCEEPIEKTVLHAKSIAAAIKRSRLRHKGFKRESIKGH